MVDFETIRDAVQELYGPSLKPMDCLKFYKPYLKVIYHDNPYPRGITSTSFQFVFLVKMASTLLKIYQDSQFSVMT